MLRIEQSYLKLLNDIFNTKYSLFYNQVKVTSSNRRTIDSIRNEIQSINDLDIPISGYLYREDGLYMLDLYSDDYFEGQIVDKNLKQILTKLKGIYLKLLSLEH